MCSMWGHAAQENVKLRLWLSSVQTHTHSPCRDLAVVHVGCNNHAGFTFVALWEGERTTGAESWFADFILMRCALQRGSWFFTIWRRFNCTTGFWQSDTDRQRECQRKIERDRDMAGTHKKTWTCRVWIQIKKLPVVFFSHRLLRTSWHIPKTFQAQIPNVTPPDTNKMAARPHTEHKLVLVFLCTSVTRPFLIDKKVVYSLAWHNPQLGRNCLWLECSGEPADHRGSLVLVFKFSWPKPIK